MQKHRGQGADAGSADVVALRPENARPGLPDAEVLRALPVAVYTTDGQGRLTFYNDAAVALWGVRPELGKAEWCGSAKLFSADGAPMRHEESPLALALKENRVVRGVQAIAERPDGSRVAFAQSPTLFRDADGALLGAVNVLVEVEEFGPTDRNDSPQVELLRMQRAETELRRLASIIESSSDAIVSKDLSGVITSWNRGAERLFGYSEAEAVGKSITMLFPLDRLDEESLIISRIHAGEIVDHYETVRRRKDGSLVEVSLTVSPVRDADGVIVGASKIARDITERKRAQHAQLLLVGEMKHRIKNTLATVQAIATQSLAAAPREQRDAFTARIQALAVAHDLLTHQNWDSAQIKTVAERTLKPFIAGAQSRIRIEGPDIPLSAARSQLFAMALHELATNAVKYGALSNATGVVNLGWSRMADGGRRVVRMTWQESGGPHVRPPTRRGFGSHIVERAFAAEGAHTELRFDPSGVVCVIEMTP